MAFDASTTESRVLSLERKIFTIRQQVDELATFRIAGVEQQLAMLWLVGPRLQQAQITGQVNGCGSVGYAGATVDVKDHTSGTVLATFTCNGSGVYSGSLTLSGSTQVVDIVATPTGPNAPLYAASATLSSVTLSAGANSIATITIPPGANYVCICTCPIPLPKTLFVGDDNGTHTLTWNGVNTWSSGNILQPGTDVWFRPPVGACTNSTTDLNYSISLTFQCPTGGGAHPTGFYQLVVGTRGVPCVVSGTNTGHFTNDAGPATGAVTVSQIVDGFTCDLSSGLNFTIPATMFFVNTLPTPGGGGPMTVMP